ncbi:MAG: hypothetical protein ACE141_03955 [Bryobacteraceae bacterium]
MRRHGFWLLGVLWLGLVTAGAQTLGNSSLTGQYQFAQLFVNASNGVLLDTRNLLGAITFDGKGGYTYTGRRGTKGGGLEPVSGQSTYTVAADGLVGMTSPVESFLREAAGLSADLKVLVGASTSSSGSLKDIFVAVKAPSSTAGAALLSGKYTAAVLQLPNGSAALARSALATMEADGAGRLRSISGRGHAADQSGRNRSFTVEPATYSLLADGSGTAAFPVDTSCPLSGTWEIRVSGDGDYILGVSSESGARDLLVAVRHYSTAARGSDFQGSYWIAELGLERKSYFVASGRVAAVAGDRAIIAERLHQDLTPLDFSGLNYYRVDADGTGALAPSLEDGLVNMALGGAGAGGPVTMAGAQVGPLGTATGAYGIFLCARAPSPSGTGAFILPSGIVNAASFAPQPHPVSPGAISALFGTELASETVTAATIPLPTSLGGVSVTVNGAPAPLFMVSATQINFQMPYEATGTSARVRVTKGAASSNEVSVPLGATSPGIFQWYDGDTPNRAIVTHADYTLVTRDSPARRGETVQIWLNGLGALDPPVATGAGNPFTEPLARAADKNIMVYFGGEPAERIDYAGGVPYLVGMNQINAKVPVHAPIGSNVPLSLATSTAYTDLVDIAIGN